MTACTTISDNITFLNPMIWATFIPLAPFWYSYWVTHWSLPPENSSGLLFSSYLQWHQKAASFMLVKNDRYLGNFSPLTTHTLTQPWDNVGPVKLWFFLWDGSSPEKKIWKFSNIEEFEDFEGTLCARTDTHLWIIMWASRVLKELSIWVLLQKSTLWYNDKSEHHCPPLCFKFDYNVEWKKVIFTVSTI